MRDKIIEVIQLFRTAKNLKRMKLKVDMKDADGNTHCFMSGSIKDSNSKVSGALNFHDASPLRSCQNGGRKITMSSEFPLSKDVEPIFQLFNASNERQELLEQDLISHPNKENDVRVKNDHIILITPPQPKLATILNRLQNHLQRDQRQDFGLVDGRQPGGRCPQINQVCPILPAKSACSVN